MIEPNFFFDASAQSGGGPALKPESRSPPPVKSRFSESDSDKVKREASRIIFSGPSTNQAKFLILDT